MQKLLFTILIVLGFNQVDAQINHATLTGTISVSTGEFFPYKLVINEADGKISGYSITYTEPNDTRATIKGTLDRSNKKLSFKELSIVYSSGFHTKAFMCLIDAHLSYVQSSRGKTLQAALSNKEADNTQCTSGTITFSNDTEIQNLFSYHDEYDTVITMKKRPIAALSKSASASVAPIKEEIAISMEKITAGIVKTYLWHSDVVNMELWNGGTTDGDNVTLVYNDKPILNHYLLTKEKKHISIPLNIAEVNSISIIANNGGNDAPNTVNLLLTDGSTMYRVLSYNKKGDKSILKIRRAK